LALLEAVEFGAGEVDFLSVQEEADFEKFETSIFGSARFSTAAARDDNDGTCPVDCG
jgi:hypothetical protein